ncbi:MAG: hypothetical protein E6J42_01275 [Chloroflexi bacterium]|nr:MAG: hypothetical protein E6J42_01275 [Chloroflexota bacterium]
MHHYKLSALLLALAALAAGFVVAARDDGEVFASGSFNPTTTVTLADHNPNAASDQNVTLNIPVNDYNFSAVVNASPAASFLAPGPGNPAFVSGTHPAKGDEMGTLSSSTFLGLTNNACNTNLTVTFVFENATVDNNSGNTMNPLTGSVAGTAGTLENMMSDDGSAASANGGAGSPPTITGPDATNGLPADVDRYPSYLNAIFDPDFINYGPDGLPFTGDDVNGPTPPVQPWARYVGNQVVAGTAVVLNLVLFSNSQLANAFAPPHPFADLGSIGWTSVAVLQDTTAAAAPGSITDFCTPLAVTTNLFGQSKSNPCSGTTLPPCNTPIGIGNPAPGVPTGKDRYRNPGTAGTYLWINFNQSLRDADQDGYENQLDTCPYTPNTENPRVTSGPDADGLDSSCDPTPSSNTNAGNHDGDVGPTARLWPTTISLTTN